jgi:hypothetical protein
MRTSVRDFPGLNALRARLAVLSAGELDARSMRAVFSKLKNQAITGHGHVQIQAAHLLFDLASGTVEDMPRDPEDTPFQKMTPSGLNKLCPVYGSGDFWPVGGARFSHA